MGNREGQGRAWHRRGVAGLEGERGILGQGWGARCPWGGGGCPRVTRALNSGSGADGEVAHLDLSEKGKCHGGQEVGLDVEPGGFVERAHHVMAPRGVLEIITQRRKSSGFKSPLHHCVSLGKSRTSCASVCSSVRWGE